MDRATPVLTVSELTLHVKSVVEADPVLAEVGVRGEVSNYKHHTSGHLYFTLKDADSQLSCVMFRGDAMRLAFEPADGLLVVAVGRVGVYEKAGRYQLYVRSMQPAGRGGLLEALERLKAKLAAEGLFDVARKRPLPAYPERVGIITSATGAAVRDMVSIIRRRFPPARLTVIPAPVQGSDAPAGLRAALRIADGRFDVLIIGRGGGSIEDLWCFNDEGLVRAVAACATPIVSAVGHETDYTLCDLAADVRAPTPSAAAEIVVPDAEELRARLRALGLRLARHLVHGAELARLRLTSLTSRRGLAQPLDRVLEFQQQLDDLQDRMARAASTGSEQRRAHVDRLAARLTALSPVRVLERGYAIVRRSDDGSLIRRVADAHAGESADVQFIDGVAAVRITGTEERALGQAT
ncbi:MAG TPA: exodeoxyribonuclease VII large subunit [Armatimonadota bacterium]|nr:exodeoxyribonuclease VII large subunit [Armatimonadota bacterium]